MYVPKCGGLRQTFLRESHDPQWAGHPRMERMYALLGRTYFWPRMHEDIELYVRTCHVCQMDKAKRRKVGGLLQPLPLPEKPWVSASMDFITGFSEVDGMKSVFVVVDRFSKFAVFIPAPFPCTAQIGQQDCSSKRW